MESGVILVKQEIQKDFIFLSYHLLVTPTNIFLFFFDRFTNSKQKKKVLLLFCQYEVTKKGPIIC